MKALWGAVRTGRAASARAAFFPKGAYVQLKAIGDPEADWQDRLLVDYRLDIRAAHQLLGAQAQRATLLRVQVPGGYAHWVEPGVCENRVGYYEVANSRVVYEAEGVVRSFGIASLISWRGVWYVIHLGDVGRVTIGGVVDHPSAGPGTSLATSTC